MVQVTSIEQCGVSVDHLRRPPVHAGWSLGSVFSKQRQGSERRRRPQEERRGGEAEEAPLSLAAGERHTHKHIPTYTYTAGVSHT